MKTESVLVPRPAPPIASPAAARLLLRETHANPLPGHLRAVAGAPATRVIPRLPPQALRRLRSGLPRTLVHRHMLTAIGAWPYARERVHPPAPGSQAIRPADAIGSVAVCAIQPPAVTRPIPAPALAPPAPSARTLPAEPSPQIVNVATEVATPPAPAPHPGNGSPALVMRGEYWDVAYGGQTAVVEDCRGLRYIALLIERTGGGRGPVHAKELVAIATGAEPAAVELERKEPVLDAVAQKQLLARLQEIASERDRACAAEMLDHAAALDEEHERIAEELRRGASTHEGRRRGAFGDAGEKARKAVSKAISEAIARVGACPDLAPLAQHLTQTIQKGQWLSYGGNESWHVAFRPPLPRK